MKKITLTLGIFSLLTISSCASGPSKEASECNAALQKSTADHSCSCDHDKACKHGKDTKECKECASCKECMTKK